LCPVSGPFRATHDLQKIIADQFFIAMKQLKPLLFVMAILLMLPTQAQPVAAADQLRPSPRRVIMGLKAGANRSNVYNSQGQDFIANPKSGFAGGAYVSIPLIGALGIQPEVLFSQKGFSGSGTLMGQPYTLTRTGNYIDVPLQLQFKLFCCLSLLAGVQYSYLLGQKDDLRFGNNNSEQGQPFKNDNIRKNTAGAVTGFDININHLVLSGRAGWDLTANHSSVASGTPRYRNFWLQGTIGIRFY